MQVEVFKKEKLRFGEHSSTYLASWTFYKYCLILSKTNLKQRMAPKAKSGWILGECTSNDWKKKLLKTFKKVDEGLNFHYLHLNSDSFQFEMGQGMFYF